MKRLGLTMLALTILLCLTIAGCSNESSPSVISEAIPENITSIEVSGYSNGNKLEPWGLTQTEIEELRTWVAHLSLEHKAYAKGEAPDEVWNGGISYDFNFNNGKLSFSWVFIDKAYIWCNSEWYEIKNTSDPPLDLSI